MFGNFSSIVKYLKDGNRFVIINGDGRQAEGIDTDVNTQKPDIRCIQSLLQSTAGNARNALATPPLFTDQLVQRQSITNPESGVCMASLWYDFFGDLNNELARNFEAERLLQGFISGQKVYGTVVVALPSEDEE